MQLVTVLLVFSVVLVMAACQARPSDRVATDSGPSSSTVSEASLRAALKQPKSGQTGRGHPGPYYLGAPGAPVAVDEYADFQCEECRRIARELLPVLIERYINPGRVQFVWHDFPSMGPDSTQAAQAARCASREEKFWEYHDALFENQLGPNMDQFSPPTLARLAGNLGLDVTAFRSCAVLGEDLRAIGEDLAAGRARGATAPPAFLVNGRMLAGNPMETLIPAIEAEAGRTGR